MVNAFWTSFCPRGSKARFASYLLKDRAYDWWEEVDHALGGESIIMMTWDDFVIIFMADFPPVIEVQQLAREV